MSFKVLISGPEAMAGSIFILYRIKGIIVPDNVQIINVNSSDNPTTRPK